MCFCCVPVTLNHKVMVLIPQNEIIVILKDECGIWLGPVLAAYSYHSFFLILIVIIVIVYTSTMCKNN